MHACTWTFVQPRVPDMSFRQRQRRCLGELWTPALNSIFGISICRPRQAHRSGTDLGTVNSLRSRCLPHYAIAWRDGDEINVDNSSDQLSSIGGFGPCQFHSQASQVGEGVAMLLKNWRSAAALSRTRGTVIVVVVVVLLEAQAAILTLGSWSSFGGDASGSGTSWEILLALFHGVSC
ncbi:hypothetical protein LZ32DRAFT_188452 [Colletotrichum eremochloae]|nr:hypothetical protein LZ32DRAFT_188452 [Colletotrichum eremochloae]